MKQENSKEESIPAFDPQVVARRAIHEKTAVWVKKKKRILSGYFGLFGLIFICFPAYIKTWREIVEYIPIVSQVFLFSTSLHGAYQLIYFAAVFAIANWISGILYPMGGHLLLEHKLPSDFFYPQTKKQEIGFWMGIFVHMLGVGVFLYFPFGMIAFFTIK